jgi:hypothetical protein
MPLSTTSVALLTLCPLTCHVNTLKLWQLPSQEAARRHLYFLPDAFTFFFYTQHLCVDACSLANTIVRHLKGIGTIIV